MEVPEVPVYGEEDFRRIASKENQPLVKVSKKDKEKFCQEVKLLIHVVNKYEKWAVLNLFKPPELHPNKPIAERPVDLFEPNWIVLGMYGGYKAALIQTQQGSESRRELEDALKYFPNAELILAIGVMYANSRDKAKFGDVIVSQVIDGVGNIRYASDDSIIVRANSRHFRRVPDRLRRIFAMGEETWYGFKCTKDSPNGEEGRESKVLSGSISSSRALVDNKDVKEKLMKNSPEALGGEMEGVILGEIQESHCDRELGVVVIKGVSDYADGTKEKKWQLTASMAAANYAQYKLESTEGTLFTEVPSVLIVLAFAALVIALGTHYSLSRVLASQEVGRNGFGDAGAKCNSGGVSDQPTCNVNSVKVMGGPGGSGGPGTDGANGGNGGMGGTAVETDGTHFVNADFINGGIGGNGGNAAGGGNGGTGGAGGTGIDVSKDDSSSDIGGDAIVENLGTVVGGDGGMGGQGMEGGEGGAGGTAVHVRTTGVLNKGLIMGGAGGEGGTGDGRAGGDGGHGGTGIKYSGKDGIVNDGTVIGSTGIHVYGHSSGNIVNRGSIIGTSKEGLELLEYLCKLKPKSEVSQETILKLAEKMGVDYTCPELE